jgi:multimeric flavodoxin WrbA
MMKIVGIISSPHAGGDEASLVREALRGAEEAGASITWVFLPGCRIEQCRDCGACVSSGHCAIPDDFQEVRELLLDADGILLASPAHGIGACPRMKNLFHRLGTYAFLTSTFGGRYVIGLAAPGRGARQLPAYSATGVFLSGPCPGGIQQALFLRPLIKQSIVSSAEKSSPSFEGAGFHQTPDASAARSGQ